MSNNYNDDDVFDEDNGEDPDDGQDIEIADGIIPEWKPPIGGWTKVSPGASGVISYSSYSAASSGSSATFKRGRSSLPDGIRIDAARREPQMFVTINDEQRMVQGDRISQRTPICTVSGNSLQYVAEDVQSALREHPQGTVEYYSDDDTLCVVDMIPMSQEIRDAIEAQKEQERQLALERDRATLDQIRRRNPALFI